MAKNHNLVLLGYQDEAISEKYREQVDFKVNKIGGDPDFPFPCRTNAICKLCKLPCRLIIQIYAPLDNCPDHRTLYLFACVNPQCWNKPESWVCLRVQFKAEDTLKPKEEVGNTIKLNSTDWCSEAEDWGDDNSTANIEMEDSNKINGNDKLSEDEESSSFDDSGLKNLTIDEENANNIAQVGAVAPLYPAMATAEIEADGENGEVVTAESPTAPQTNLEALLQSGASDMDNIPNRAIFLPYFMSVYSEEDERIVMDDHVKDLLHEYQKRDGDVLLVMGSKGENTGGSDCDLASEDYEKSRPLHGDKTFHHFVSKIKNNPEQILRYHREGAPLLLYPMEEKPGVCKYCKDDLVFEFQLVPTLLSKLRLSCDPPHCTRLDFGTVLVYTCRSSCWGSNDSYREEIVVVQKEIL